MSLTSLPLPLSLSLSHRYIRASLYRYEFTKIGSPEAKTGKWWKRRKIGEYIPIVSEQNLRPVIEQQGWVWYNKDTS